MLSKELVSELLDKRVKSIHYKHMDRNMVSIELDNEDTCWWTINIYELANKCKEWAYVIGYELSSTIMCNDHNSFGNVGVFLKDSEADSITIVTSKTEPEAIFKACQWIIDNKGDTNEQA